MNRINDHYSSQQNMSSQIQEKPPQNGEHQTLQAIRQNPRLQATSEQP